MRKIVKLFGFFAFLAIIGSFLFSCSDTGNGSDNSFLLFLPKGQSEPSALTGTVSINGTAQVGQVLTANTSGLGGSGEISYQWKRGGTNIGSNSSTYTVVSADVGSTITVTVTRSGYSGSVTSASTAPINPIETNFNIIGAEIFTYDGTERTVIITAKDNRSTENISVYYTGINGTAYAKSIDAPSAAGVYVVTFDITSAEGSNVFTGLVAGTLTINKANGVIITSPVFATIGVNSITLDEITAPSNGQNVEYAINTSNIAPVSGWQTDTTFNGLTAGTIYFAFARSIESDNYYTGEVSSGTKITTLQQASATIISYWADDIGSIIISRQGNGQIINDIVTVTYGNNLIFTPIGIGYSNYYWTLNGVSAGTNSEYTFSTIDKEPSKNYIVGLRVDKDGKPYYTQIIVKITSLLIFFSENFDGPTHSFTIANGSQTNKWYVGTAIANEGTKSAYISNNSGTSNAYTISSSSTVHMYCNIVFPASTEPYTLKFNWRGEGESGYDDLNVRLVETTVTPSTGSTPTGTSLGTFRGSGTWTQAAVSIPAFNNGTTKRLVFTWRNDNSAGTQPPIAVDDIELLSSTQ